MEDRSVWGTEMCGGGKCVEDGSVWRTKLYSYLEIHVLNYPEIVQNEYVICEHTFFIPTKRPRVRVSVVGAYLTSPPSFQANTETTWYDKRPKVCKFKIIYLKYFKTNLID